MIAVGLPVHSAAYTLLQHTLESPTNPSTSLHGLLMSAITMLHSRPVRFFFLIGSASLLFVWLCDVYRLSQYKPLYPDPPKFRFFHWDTKPFLEPFSEAKVSSPCDRFPQRVFNNVQVVLKTGLTESPERIQSHLKSVTKCFPNLLIVSDYDGIVNEYHVHDVLADLSEAYSLDNPDFDTYYTQKAMLEANNITEYNNQAGWKLDRFKFLPMVHKAYTMHQTAYWFVFIETDTYIFWDNLLRMLENLDPLVPQYIGSPLHGDGLMYAYGGSGIVLSRAAIEALLDRETDGHGSYTSVIIYEQDEWVERVKKTTYGEMVLGEALLERADVKLSGYFPMFYPLNIESLEFSNDVWCVPIISMHKLQTLEQYEELWNWEMGPGDDNVGVEVLICFRATLTKTAANRLLQGVHVGSPAARATAI